MRFPLPALALSALALLAALADAATKPNPHHPTRSPSSAPPTASPTPQVSYPNLAASAAITARLNELRSSVGAADMQRVR